MAKNNICETAFQLLSVDESTTEVLKSALKKIEEKGIINENQVRGLECYICSKFTACIGLYGELVILQQACEIKTPDDLRNKIQNLRESIIERMKENERTLVEQFSQKTDKVPKD